MVKTALAKLLTLKVAAAATVAVGAAGGAALAANGGTLPGVSRAERPVAQASAAANADPADNTRGKASPSPSLVGLCRAFHAGAGSNPGKALENPAFGALIAAAGDKDKVEGFCETVLAAKASAAPDGGPEALPSAAADEATNHPTAPPAGRPTVRPSR